jgi:hypothetical protein
MIAQELSFNLICQEGGDMLRFRYRRLLQIARRGFLSATYLAVSVLFSTSVLAQSNPPPDMTPDWDGNGFNNSFERAVDLGELRPAGVNVREQLGKVPWGFDTRDFYRFMFPTGVNDFQLAVHPTETPIFTMWINIYDQRGKLVFVSQGSANETFSIPLPGGVYFIEVVTSEEVAAGRNLQYTLAARPVEVPLPDKGGTSCKGAPSVGLIGAQRVDIEGNLDEMRKSSVYGFYTAYSASLQGNMLGLQPSRRYRLTVTDRLNGNQIPFRNETLMMEGILLDPGFYCLTIESVGWSGLGNYKGQFTAPRAGLPPGNNKQLAQNIIDMELGNLSTNGSYGFVSRYAHYQTPGQHPNVPTVIEYGHDYVIRDWVGLAAPDQYYWFYLPGKSRVEARLSNQLAFARAYIEDADGNVLANSIVDSSSLDPDLMPSQSLAAILPSGKRYYLRISYASNSNPGTSFAISLKAASTD